MTGHAGQVRAVVTGAGSLEIKWPLNPPTTSRRSYLAYLACWLPVVCCGAWLKAARSLFDLCAHDVWVRVLGMAEVAGRGRGIAVVSARRVMSN